MVQVKAKAKESAKPNVGPKRGHLLKDGTAPAYR